MVTHCHCCIVVPYMTDYIMTLSHTCVPHPWPVPGPHPKPPFAVLLLRDISSLVMFTHTGSRVGGNPALGGGAAFPFAGRTQVCRAIFPLESCDSQPPFRSNSAVRPHWASAAEGAAPGSDLN